MNKPLPPDEMRPWRRWITPELPALGRLLHLDVWGDSLLSGAAAAQMRAAAAALLAVFLFELVAWSVFFHTTVTGDPMRLTLLSATVGLALGTLCAGTIILFEWGLVTLDTSDGRWKWVVALRGFVIAVSVCATAQPLHLLVFHVELDQRLRDEARLQVAVDLATELKEMDRRRDEDLERLQGESQADRLKQAQTEFENALGAMTPCFALPGVQAEVAAARGASDGSDAAERVLAALERRKGWVNSRCAVAKAALEKAKEARASTGATYTEKQKKIDELRATADDARKTQIQEGVKQLRAMANGGPDAAFDPSSAGLLRRLALIEDLTAGRPPAWPLCGEEARRIAIDTFPVFDPEGDDLSKQRLVTLSHAYWVYYWISFAVAGIFPAVGLLTKLTMGRELSKYYQLDVQARAGEPGAREVAET